MAKKSIEFHAIVMGFGNFNLDFRESSGNFFCQNTNNGVFRVEMAGINDGHFLIATIPEVIVFYVRGDEGVAACIHCVHEFRAAGTAAHSNLPHRLSAVHISQNRCAEDGLDLLHKLFQRLLRNFTAVEKSPLPSFRVYAAGKDYLYIFQTQQPGKLVVDTAGTFVQIGVGIDTGNAVFDQKQHIPSPWGPVSNKAGLPNQSVVG